MGKKQEENLLKVFSKAFHEVVPPLLEPINGRLDSLENGQDRIERTLIRIEDHLDRDGQQLDKHETKLERLEKIHPGGKHTLSGIA